MCLFAVPLFWNLCDLGVHFLKNVSSSGCHLGAILEPGGHLGPILDPPKKQTPKKSPTYPIAGRMWGYFLDHFGVIFGPFLA